MNTTDFHKHSMHGMGLAGAAPEMAPGAGDHPPQLPGGRAAPGLPRPDIESMERDMPGISGRAFFLEIPQMDISATEIRHAWLGGSPSETSSAGPSRSTSGNGACTGPSA